MNAENAANLPTLAQIRELIANRPRRITLTHVADAANVSVSWLSQVLNGEIEAPSYERMRAIYEYLTTHH